MTARPFLAAALSLVCVVALYAQKKSGVDTSSIDTNCKPCDDFWRYANGSWLDKNPVPPAESRWGQLNILTEGNRERLRALLESAAATSAKPGSNERKLGDLYSACMDVAAVNAKGAKPLAAEFERISNLKSVQDLVALLAQDQLDLPFGPVTILGRQDLKSSSETVAYVYPDGFSLPDRDYYFKDDERSKKIRAEFLLYAAKLFEESGTPAPAAASAAKDILAFETALAQPTLTRVQRRDPAASYHPVGLSGARELLPTYDWKAAFARLQIPESTLLIVAEPEHLKVVERQLHAVPLDTWKTWLRWQHLSSAAPYLSQPFVDESFRFNSTVLNGVTEQRPRWRTCADVADRSLGEALGELFVRKHFPPAAKARMNELVTNVRAALGEQLQSADWLSPETRKQALAKLGTFAVKIGYPDHWRDYSPVQVSRSDLLHSVRSASTANRRYELAKIGKPLNRADWRMTPPTVNAYYNPLQNEIVFPAGILQPPLFDLNADDAANYGAIGAVIGHEIGHGFDDQGSKFASDGNLRNWWTAADRENFDARASCVVDQFNNLDVGEGLRHNGRLVVGEAMGDLGGLTLAYRAYQKSLNGKPAPVLDGFTGDQRFFLSFARVWAAHLRPEAVRLRLVTDPHPLNQFRVTGTLQNMPEFHQAFQCKEGDPMVRPPAKLCRLW